ncbi:MAG: 5-formyltetrahydrofolate cyclo-ligase [Pseudomonadota bacterium]
MRRHSLMNDAARAELDAAKAEFRAEMRRRREGAHAAAGPAAALALRERFFEGPAAGLRELPGAVVAGFWPFGSEIDPRPILYRLHAAGHPIGLPVVVARGFPLLFRAWRPGLELVTGSFGISRPDKHQPELTPRVLMVPLLAFDRGGYRLGYGGGFYDRSLAGLRANGPVLAIGVGFAVQEVPAVPRDPGDERLDWMVTEGEAFRVSLRAMNAGDLAS